MGDFVSQIENCNDLIMRSIQISCNCDNPSCSQVTTIDTKVNTLEQISKYDMKERGIAFRLILDYIMSEADNKKCECNSDIEDIEIKELVSCYIPEDISVKQAKVFCTAVFLKIGVISGDFRGLESFEPTVRREHDYAALIYDNHPITWGIFYFQKTQDTTFVIGYKRNQTNIHNLQKMVIFDVCTIKGSIPSNKNKEN
jgi:hypothetical protein